MAKSIVIKSRPATESEALVADLRRAVAEIEALDPEAPRVELQRAVIHSLLARALKALTPH